MCIRDRREREQRIEVALPAGEGEQDPHQPSLWPSAAAIDAATSAPIPSREPADA